MTSETSDQAQIQSLINGIDEALNKTSPRLPWVMSNDAAQQRQVLEQTRQYLTALQQQSDATQQAEATAAPLPVAMPPQSLPSSESAQQVLQAVLQEMNYWRVNMLQPLRTEIDSLQRQREMLTQEIRQLEHRQQHLAGQPNQQLLIEFLQSAMAQMQANLSNQVTQMIAGQMQSSGQPALSASLTSAERLAQMQTAQMQSDQLMLKLDSTLQVIFESLNRNVQTYEESLEQGLNRMHSLGQQGEAMFAFLVNRLAQQLGREASTFLQASAPTNWPQSSLPADSEREAATEATSEPKPSDFLSQIPNASSTFVPAVPFDLSEEVLDISELELLDLPDQALDESLDQPLDQSLPPNNLEGLDLELSQLDLGAIPVGEPPLDDLFAGDQPLSAEPPAEAKFVAPTVVNDLDSALDLLNQLSAEMQANLAVDEETPPASAELSQETELITVPDSLYDDAFYSLTDLTDPPQPAREASPFDAMMTLEQTWFDGLGDPAGERPADPISEPAFSESPVNQSLENFLLNSPAPTAADPDLFAEFVEPADSDSQPSPIESGSESADLESVETITSLTDLIPIAEPSQAPSPEVPIVEAPSDFRVDLGNDADMLAQLGADLAQFGAADSPLEPTATDWDFADAPDAEPDAESASDSMSELGSAAASEPNSNPPMVTIEGLEDLFADLPSETSQIEATPDLFAQLKAAFAPDTEPPLDVEQPIVLKYLDSEPADPADSTAADSTDASDPEKKK